MSNETEATQETFQAFIERRLWRAIRQDHAKVIIDEHERRLAAKSAEVEIQRKAKKLIFDEGNEEIAALKAELSALKQERDKAKQLVEEYKTQIGCPLCRQTETRAEQAEAALEAVLSSATPHPGEHPVMAAAWAKGRAAIASAKETK